MPPVTAILMGAGERGTHTYGAYARQHPEALRFVAVAEPRSDARARFATWHDIPVHHAHLDWQALLASAPAADACIVATPDRDHAACAAAALDAGYHLLLEKPIARTLEESVALARHSSRSDRIVHLAHVLRATPFFRRLHEIAVSGQLGDIVAVVHSENVACTHMAHSYVRGNWRRAELASPMLLAKCCHDLDILCWNLGAPVQRLSSFGSLMHFRPRNAPAGAPERCTDGCPAAASCPFDAQRIYLDPAIDGWPVSTIAVDTSPAGRRRALEQGPYGRCVYRCDNDVVDHQTVSMELDGGATAVLVMHGHSHAEQRTMRYSGTRATLRGVFGARSLIEIHEHAGGRCERIELDVGAAGHGGGDSGLMDAFVAAVRGQGGPRDTLAEALESHLLAFAAERSRLCREVVEMDAFRRACHALGT